MNQFDMDLDAVTLSDGDLDRLEKLIGSVDRPGDYCAHGCLVAPAPRIEVGEIGTLSLPIPRAQVKELVADSDPAPYGRGPDTIVDPGVRNCRQIGSGMVDVAGRVWNSTFSGLLDRAADGLGCPRDRLDAELYKLLVYETGGFFAPHRDTEKAEGMVATLVIALPVAGRGGELVVRHRDRETVIDMTGDDPAELSWAAFYADCEHEIRPVTEGSRVCLVYNLMLKEGGGMTLRAPDHDGLIGSIAEELAVLARPSRKDRKLVWLLEHDYSEAGLSFDTLKNTDRAVGQVLAAASREAGYLLHAAILHVEETYGAEYLGYGYVREIEDVDDRDVEVYDTIESICSLDCWTSPDGREANYGDLPLLEGELMPLGRLDPGAPDTQRLTEATGNEGATLERLYRRAVLVLWPEPDTLCVLGSAGTGAVLAYLAGKLSSADGPAPSGFRELADRAAEHWPPPSPYSSVHWIGDTVKMLGILSAGGSREALAVFVRKQVVPQYEGGFNESLSGAAMRLGPGDIREVLTGLVREKIPDKIEDIVDLAELLCGCDGQEELAREWEETLREMVKAICAGMPSVRGRRKDPWYRTGTDPLPLDTLGKFFRLAWRFGLGDEVNAAAVFLISRDDLAPPDRTIPGLLGKLYVRESPGGGVGSGFAELWSHTTRFLLSRSSTPPKPPLTWVLAVDQLNCGCTNCLQLRKFCEHPTVRVCRFRARKEIRKHIESEIRLAGLDIDCDTETTGSPHVLVCAKNRATWERRLGEYREDIGRMKVLEGVAGVVPESGACAEAIRAAISRAPEPGDGGDSSGLRFSGLAPDEC